MSGSRLRRDLSMSDAVVVGLAAMIGTGVFVVWQPAVTAAGGAVLLALLLAAFVAWLNATSTAGLAARHPRAGGAYHYGRIRLGPMWGSLAGFAFVIGKTASAATAALAIGTYLWPAQADLIAVLAVVALTAVNIAGVHKTALVSRVLVVLVALVLLAVSTVAVARETTVQPIVSFANTGPVGVLTGAAVLFYAFAGYARIATLGEEIREPERSIPRAVFIALGLALVLYALVGAAVLATLGVDAAASSTLPVRAMAEAANITGLVVVVVAGAALAALGALLSLLAGIGRTAFAMADDGVLPRRLAAVHPRSGVPHRAEIAAAAVAVAAVLLGDLVTTLSVSAFTVLVYYAVAHVAATRLAADERWFRAWVPWAGLVSCLALAASLPWHSVVIGVVALVVATGTWWVVDRIRR